MSERSTRISTGHSAKASVTAGRMKLLRLAERILGEGHPAGRRQPVQLDGEQVDQQDRHHVVDGSDSLPKASPVKKRSSAVPLFTAHRMASGMAITSASTTADDHELERHRQAVGHRGHTVSPVRKERPRSPCSTPHSQMP